MSLWLSVLFKNLNDIFMIISLAVDSKYRGGQVRTESKPSSKMQTNGKDILRTVVLMAHEKNIEGHWIF